MAAAAIAAIDILQEEPERVVRRAEDARFFLQQAKSTGLNTSYSIGAGIIPVITESSIAAAAPSDALFRRGINVQPRSRTVTKITAQPRTVSNHKGIVRLFAFVECQPNRRFVRSCRTLLSMTVLVARIVHG